ncbi:MAG: arsenical efflux pump membrane protein ArsB [Coleofasciculaceae cyanobacterium]
MAIAIFLSTLTLVIWQPRGLGIGFAAMLGALLALVTGVVSLEDLPTIWALVWNATFTLVALVIISLILDAAGFFQWLALILAQLGLGRGRWLFCLVVLLGALITALLTNDGTTLIWTPTVLEMLLLLGFNRRATLAFVFATGFIADAASSPLIVSNLVNILSADYFQISFLRYALVMVPVNFVAISCSLAVLWFYFDRDIPQHYQQNLPLPITAIRDPLVCQWSLPILGLLLIGYFVAAPLSIPISLIAGLNALIMLSLAGRWFHKKQDRVIDIRKIWQEAPWQVILFSLGMYVVVIGLYHDEISNLLTQQLVQLSGWGLTIAATGTGLLATALASTINNLPAVLINNLAMPDAIQIDPVVREVMVYANILGCNIGAKITPIGSLSTLLWFNVLARKGLNVSWFEYVRLAFVITLPVLLVCELALAIWLPWLIA